MSEASEQEIRDAIDEAFVEALDAGEHVDLVALSKRLRARFGDKALGILLAVSAELADELERQDDEESD